MSKFLINCVRVAVYRHLKGYTKVCPETPAFILLSNLPWEVIKPGLDSGLEWNLESAYTR